MVMEVNNNKDNSIKIIFIIGCILMAIVIILGIYVINNPSPVNEIKDKCIKLNNLNSQYGKIYGNLSKEQKEFILNNCV